MPAPRFFCLRMIGGRVGLVEFAAVDEEVAEVEAAGWFGGVGWGLVLDADVASALGCWEVDAHDGFGFLAGGGFGPGGSVGGDEDFEGCCPLEFLVVGGVFVAVDGDDGGDFGIAGEGDLGPWFGFRVGIEPAGGGAIDDGAMGEGSVELAGAAEGEDAVFGEEWGGWGLEFGPSGGLFGVEVDFRRGGWGEEADGHVCPESPGGDVVGFGGFADAGGDLFLHGAGAEGFALGGEEGADGFGVGGGGGCVGGEAVAAPVEDAAEDAAFRWVCGIVDGHEFLHE